MAEAEEGEEKERRERSSSTIPPIWEIGNEMEGEKALNLEKRGRKRHRDRRKKGNDERVVGSISGFWFYI